MTLESLKCSNSPELSRMFLKGGDHEKAHNPIRSLMLLFSMGSPRTTRYKQLPLRCSK